MGARFWLSVKVERTLRGTYEQWMEERHVAAIKRYTDPRFRASDAWYFMRVICATYLVYR